MKITKHTDYAVRVLIYLSAHGDRRIPTQEIAEAYDISVHHLQKIVRALGELGVLDLKRGVGGGVSLARDPADISAGAVMRAMDRPESLIECFNPEADGCAISPACGLKGALGEAREAFYRVLDPITIADVVRGKRAARVRKLTGS